MRCVVFNRNNNMPRAGIRFRCTLLLNLVSAPLFFLWMTLCCMQADAAEQPGQKILVLHSYHQGYLWTDMIQEGISRTLTAPFPNAELYVEYMNTKRQTADVMFPHLVALYKHLYQNVKFDVIIASDNNALDFLLRYRDKLFPSVPVVFCGINDVFKYHFKPTDGYTGVSEDLDIVSTLQIALTLHPGTKQVALITDATESGQINLGLARSISDQFPDVVFLEFNKLTLSQLGSRLNALAGDTIVLALSFFRDPEGTTFSARESMEFIVGASRRPVYTVWDFYMVPGALGGKLLSGRLQGESAAGLVTRILRGEKPGAIPEVASPTAYMFDSIGLQKFGISESQLPAGSLVLGKPDTFYVRYKYYLWFGFGLFLAQAMIIGLLSWNISRRRREVVARQKVEEDLSYSISLTNAALESTADSILIVDNTGKIARWNQKFVDLWQVPKELLDTQVKDPVLKYVTAQMAKPEEFLSKVMELYADPEQSSVDTLRLADGRIVERYSQPQRIGDEIVGRFWSFRDVTERKRMEKALAENENRLRTVVQTIPDLIWLKDADGVYQSCNKEFERLFGAREADIIGKTDYDFVDRELADFFRKHDRGAMEAGRPRVNEEWVTFADDGRRALLETVKTPMYDTEGKLLGVLGIARDVTLRKEHERELLKIEKLESLGVLAGGIAHDFNNILTGIMGNISFALMMLDPTNKAYSRLIEAEKASTRAGELALQLLTFARGGEPIKRVISLRHLVNESVSLLLRGSNVKGILELPDTLDAVKADEGQLNQVFNNIVMNAKQAMPTGGVLTVIALNETLPEANLLALPAGKYVKISFSDEGCGISPEHMQRIFDPYFTTKEYGNGLGLASAYSIISRHGGNISVASKVGKGTTFTMYLPTTNEAFARAQTEIVESGASVHQGGSILVMDDEEIIRDLTAKILEHHGYQAMTCDNGAEAVTLYKEAKLSGKPFLAVIMDLTVAGGMGGKEAAEQILAIDPTACLIVSSGYSNDPIMSDYTTYGFRAAVAKPYNVKEFTRLLGSLLEL